MLILILINDDDLLIVKHSVKHKHVRVKPKNHDSICELLTHAWIQISSAEMLDTPVEMLQSMTLHGPGHPKPASTPLWIMGGGGLMVTMFSIRTLGLSCPSSKSFIENSFT